MTDRELSSCSIKKVYLVYTDLGCDSIHILGVASTVETALEIAAVTGHLNDENMCVEEFKLDNVALSGQGVVVCSYKNREKKM